MSKKDYIKHLVPGTACQAISTLQIKYNKNNILYKRHTYCFSFEYASGSHSGLSN